MNVHVFRTFWNNCFYILLSYQALKSFHMRASVLRNLTIFENVRHISNHVKYKRIKFTRQHITNILFQRFFLFCLGRENLRIIVETLKSIPLCIVKKVLCFIVFFFLPNRENVLSSLDKL